MLTLLYLVCIFSNIFSFALIFKGGGALSIIAALSSLAFSGTFTFFSSLPAWRREGKNYFIIKKMAEYLPLVCVAFFVLSAVFAKPNYALDAFLVVCWTLCTFCTIILLFLIRESAMKKKHPKLFKTEKKHSAHFALLDWADAIVQSACIVILLQFFVFQLYLIPSESMVPTFMIGDRVVGIKCLAGPTFPLSSFRFPKLQEYKRGDVVVVRNPNYESEKYNELKFFTSQLIQLITLTFVNINKDEAGRVKADPLVKRIVACPGEKLMLVDGVLYIKKAGEKDWKVQDESKYAVWNIESLPQSDLKHVRDKKIGADVVHMLESIEAMRKNLDFQKALKEARSIVDEMERLKGVPDSTAITEEILKKDEITLENIVIKDLELASKILTTNGALNWFYAFMTDWAQSWQTSREDASLYEKRFAQLNVLIKLAVGRLLLKDVALLKENLSSKEQLENEERGNLLNELRQYYYYLALSGQRNMNEFPKGDGAYIPEGAFFLMGDNRFNSTDMRHGYKLYKTSVDSEDPLSIKYMTNLHPRYMREERILGIPAFIFWPKDRAGTVK